MSHALEVRALRKSFGKTKALHGIDLTVPKGSVYGLVGLNGAGKTTTLECALGLQRPDSGTTSVHATVGAVFDTPGLHPNLTVQQELELGHRLCRGRGHGPDDVIKWLGLAPSLRKRTSRLSLGNRRRTSIALALLGSPELVVLDEPFVGLDARGVDELLSLVARLNEEGTTFVLSSHQLELVERICTHLGCIHQGRVVVEGECRVLLEGQTQRLRLRVNCNDKARKVLRSAYQLDPTEEGGALCVDVNGDDPAAINQSLVQAGVRVSELRHDGASLAALFRSWTGAES